VDVARDVAKDVDLEVPRVEVLLQVLDLEEVLAHHQDLALAVVATVAVAMAAVWAAPTTPAQEEEVVVDLEVALEVVATRGPLSIGRMFPHDYPLHLRPRGSSNS